jgi:hypothetical protein
MPITAARMSFHYPSKGNPMSGVGTFTMLKKELETHWKTAKFYAGSATSYLLKNKIYRNFTGGL